MLKLLPIQTDIEFTNKLVAQVKRLQEEVEKLSEENKKLRNALMAIKADTTTHYNEKV